MTAVGAAELAATRKEVKYVELSTTPHFVPLAIESLSPIGSRATHFFKKLGHRLTLGSGQPQENPLHLFQRLPLALQSFNAEYVLNCLGGK